MVIQDAEWLSVCDLLCWKALRTMTLCALYVLMGLADQISSGRSEGYESDVKSIDPHKSQHTLASLSAGS